MSTLIAIPILGGLLIIQTAILSRFPLIRGTADLVLLTVIAWSLQKRTKTAWQWGIIGGLFVGFMSQMPFVISLLLYPLAAGFGMLLRRRIWQVPILAMFIATFVSTLAIHLVTILARWIGGSGLPIELALNLITLPSMILNLVLAIPIFVLITDLAKWVYPEEIEI